ncbi:MAG: hypothetical protein M3O70_17600, partial [Actinomycetota bacterium]|nr:hypothetical protein [Actinomycetota bacterium]
ALGWGALGELAQVGDELALLIEVESMLDYDQVVDVAAGTMVARRARAMQVDANQVVSKPRTMGGDDPFQ